MSENPSALGEPAADRPLQGPSDAGGGAHANADADRGYESPYRFYLDVRDERDGLTGGPGSGPYLLFLDRPCPGFDEAVSVYEGPWVIRPAISPLAEIPPEGQERIREAFVLTWLKNRIPGGDVIPSKSMNAVEYEAWVKEFDEVEEQIETELIQAVESIIDKAPSGIRPPLREEFRREAEARGKKREVFKDFIKVQSGIPVEGREREKWDQRMNFHGIYPFWDYCRHHLSSDPGIEQYLGEIYLRHRSAWDQEIKREHDAISRMRNLSGRREALRLGDMAEDAILERLRRAGVARVSRDEESLFPAADTPPELFAYIRRFSFVCRQGERERAAQLMESILQPDPDKQTAAIPRLRDRTDFPSEIWDGIAVDATRKTHLDYGCAWWNERSWVGEWDSLEAGACLTVLAIVADWWKREGRKLAMPARPSRPKCPYQYERWSEIRMKFVDGETVVVWSADVPAQTSVTHAMMGAIDGRKPGLGPSQAWKDLIELAEGHGEINIPRSRSRSRKAKLAAMLKSYFGLTDDPLESLGARPARQRKAGCYKARFSITPEL